MDSNIGSFASTEDNKTSEAYVSGAAMVMIFLIAVYINAEAFIESKKPIIGHATTVVVLLGMLISYIGFLIDHNFEDEFKFSDDIFFYVCLPPIVFSSGFNMRRKKFFANFGYVLLFGVIGTIICFLCFTFMTIGFNELEFFKM